jgi:hypothetical protein
MRSHFLLFAAVWICISKTILLGASDTAIRVTRDRQLQAWSRGSIPEAVADRRPTESELDATDPKFLPPPPPIVEPQTTREPPQENAPNGGTTTHSTESEPPTPAGGPPMEEVHAVSGDKTKRMVPPNKEATPAVTSAGLVSERVGATVDATDERLPAPLYEPNQAGVIVIPGPTTADERAVPNPFDIRWVAPKAVNELNIRLGGVVLGPKPTALINGRPFSRGERWSGFNVVKVTRDRVLMEHNGFFVSIPRGRPIVIRLPH